MIPLFPSDPLFANRARENADKTAAELREDERLQSRGGETPKAGVWNCCCSTKQFAIFADTDHRTSLAEDDLFNATEIEFLLYLGLLEKVGRDFVYDRNGAALCKTLSGRDGLRINHTERMEMSSFDVFNKRYVAISYKHMNWVKLPRDAMGRRGIKMPVVEANEVKTTMAKIQRVFFWHDGVEDRYNRGNASDRENPSCGDGRENPSCGDGRENPSCGDGRENPSCGYGLFPYLLDGSYVLVVPPTCGREEIPDPTTWVSQEYPNAQEAFAECVRYTFKMSGGEPQLLRRKTPGVPSVAWGSMMRVWMLAESFCGCLHGRIGFTQAGQRRILEFIREIRTVIFMVERLQVEIVNKMLKGEHIQDWETSSDKREKQLKELYYLLRDVVNYYTLVADPKSERSALSLSRFFLERMAFANATNPSDRVVVGSMCAMMLQQVFGHGLAIDTAIQRYEESQDPLSFAVMVASSGHNALPLSATTQQVRASGFALKMRTSGGHYGVKDSKTMMSQWPQPMPGRCYAGTLTMSPWKSIFWHALCHNRGLGKEYDIEKARRKTAEASPEYKRRVDAANAARQSHFKTRRSMFSKESSRIGKEVDRDTVLYDPTHSGSKIYQPLGEKEDLSGNLSPELEEKRQAGLRAVIHAWTQSQANFVPVIGKNLPLLFERKTGMVAMYVMDTASMEGYERKSLVKATWPLEVSDIMEYSTKLLFAKGTSSSVNIVEHPLLQLVLCLNQSHSPGYLVAMRRVFNPILAGGMPARPQDIQNQMVNPQYGDASALLEAHGFERDWIIPARVVRSQLADYTQMSDFEVWHVPGIISRYHDFGCSVEKNSTKWEERWAQVEEAMATPWNTEIPRPGWRTAAKVLQLSTGEEPTEDMTEMEDIHIEATEDSKEEIALLHDDTSEFGLDPSSMSSRAYDDTLAVETENETNKKRKKKRNIKKSRKEKRHPTKPTGGDNNGGKEHLKTENV